MRLEALSSLRSVTEVGVKCLGFSRTAAIHSLKAGSLVSQSESAPHASKKEGPMSADMGMVDMVVRLCPKGMGKMAGTAQL